MGELLTVNFGAPIAGLVANRPMSLNKFQFMDKNDLLEGPDPVVYS